MKIAFIILAYKLPDQLRLMIDSLEHPDFHFFVHVDRTKEIRPFEESLSTSNANIHFIHRINSYWGSYNTVKALIGGIRQAYLCDFDFDYYIHLSGQDFPVKSTEKIREVLSGEVPNNFLSISPFPFKEWANGGKDRLTNFKFFWRGRRYIINRNTSNFLLWVLAIGWEKLTRYFDEDYTFYGGEFYFMLHSSGVKRLLENIKKYKFLALRLQFTSLPEEIYIPTMISQPAVNEPPIFIVKDKYRYIEWVPGEKSPKTLDKNVIFELGLTHYLFARKFEF